MFSPKDYSKILFAAYDNFLLPLGGKKVPTPYRRNEIGNFQKVGPEFQGKSSPEVLIKTTIKLAGRQGFKLNKASVEDIRNFMKQNKLGIDCSGFAYRMLNYLVEKLGLGSLESLGLPHVGRTNVVKLTSDEFTVPVADFLQARPGDLIKLDSGKDIHHCVIILENKNGTITYAHSSNETNPDGVHQDYVSGNTLPPDLAHFSYQANHGDGIRRLKILA